MHTLATFFDVSDDLASVQLKLGCENHKCYRRRLAPVKPMI